MTIDEMIEEEEKKMLQPCNKHCQDKNIITCESCRTNHKAIIEWLTRLKKNRQLKEQGRLIKLPCKVGDTVYVASSILPIKNIEHYEDVDNEVPAYFTGRVVSFRFAKRNWIKIAVKAKWLHEWIDDETGPESNYIKSEKYFTVILSSIGKTVFLSKQEAETKLKN